MAMPTHLCIAYGSFCTPVAELGSFNKPIGLQSLKYLLSGPLQRKFADPWANLLLNISTEFFTIISVTQFLTDSF